MTARSDTGRDVFEYALLRAVPRVDRGECVNIGVVLYCRGRGFLRTVVELDGPRLRALDPDVDLGAVRDAAAAVERTCLGQGPAGATSLGQRFRWLTAPRSTVVQAGPVHPGLTADPDAELARLLETLVRRPRAGLLARLWAELPGLPRLPALPGLPSRPGTWRPRGGGPGPAG